ncbi:MAG: hypothetical protein GX952_06665 [Firmicutes bacterium]|nr:hypothetical protein [Bacillota bacterium]
MVSQNPSGQAAGGFYRRLILQAILLVMLGRYNLSLALLGAAITVGLLWHELRHQGLPPQPTAMSDLVTEGESEGIARKALLRSPVPIALISKTGRLLLANKPFAALFPKLQRGRKFPDGLPVGPQNKTGQFIEVNGTPYEVICEQYDTFAGLIQALYLLDRGEIKQLQQAVKEQSPVLGLLQVDNYEEVLARTPESQQPLLKGAIDKLLTDWAQNADAYIHRYAPDRYILVLNGRGLAQNQENKFDLLDRVKEIDFGNIIPVTISIGLGAEADNLAELSSYARLALDLALGRGGDQVVIKTAHDFTYYGGKTMAPEKRTKVRARVIAQALKELIAAADRVVVMGHASADADSLGAAVALARAARAFGKAGYVVLDKVTPAIEIVYNYLHEHETYREIFVEPGVATQLVSDKTLLIVVDTHKPSLVVAPRLLKRTRKIVVIDHHRRAEEFISDPTLIYLESYASSTSELVTEILQYLDGVQITSLEATALLAGITVDTKNFAFQTGVRTFEAAAYLRRSGADARLIQRLFQDSWGTFIRRAQVIEATALLPGGIAMTMVNDDGAKDNQLLAAQVANELLHIEGVRASFVLYSIKDGAAVSARSLGDVNVQILMEKLGGGGHLNIAGAQLRGLSLATAKDKLEQVLNDYLTEEGEAK